MIQILHDNDPMFAGNKEHYIKCGGEIYDIVKRYANKLNYSSSEDIKILELPAGYGRVTRHLVSGFNPANVYTIDIYDEACEFQRNIFKTNSIKINAEDYTYKDIPNNEFDIAVMGSLITHLNEEASKSVLISFMNKITNIGFGIITTHGQRSYELLKDSNVYQVSENDRNTLLNDYEKDKFSFCLYRNDHTFEKHTTDVAGDSYGISLIPNFWVEDFCKSNNLLITEHIAAGWDNHQDVYIIQNNQQ